MKINRIQSQNKLVQQNKLATEKVLASKNMQNSSAFAALNNYGGGNTNAEEAFAEAFKLYIIRGPGKLGEWTRWFFREIVRTGGATLK